MKKKLVKTWTSEEKHGYKCKANIYQHRLGYIFDVNAWVMDASTWERLSKVHKYTYSGLTLERILEGLEEINTIQ